MDKKEFDFDFDFEKEFGTADSSDVNDDLFAKYMAEDMDDPASGITDDVPDADFDYGSFDYDSAEDDESLYGSFGQEQTQQDDPCAGEVYESETYEGESFEEEPDDQEPYAEEDYQEEPAYAQEEAETDLTEDIPMPSGEYAAYQQEEYQEEEPEEAEEEVPEKPKRKMPKVNIPKINLPKLPKREGPSLFSRLLDIYMEPLRTNAQITEEIYIDPETGRSRRRRKKSKQQIFKEVYLPAIIAGAALVLMLGFMVGSVMNALERKQINDEKARLESIAQQQEQEVLAGEFQTILAQAEELAQSYNYKQAIAVLEEFGNENPKYQTEINAKRAEYANVMTTMTEYKDFSTIPNLSFHVLMNDPVRAIANKELGGQYNRNFVSVGEFQKILEQLYTSGYILVDFDSFVGSSTSLDGNKNFETMSIFLPQGKKPVMITETMVNYYDYMIDGNKDGTADADGSGFASKLVVDANGDIKAEYVDENGVTSVGNYDLVPVLEEFIKQHPDFSYQGARAILAVSGIQGVFGYRTNTSYVTDRGNAYYEQEVAAAKVVVEALREKGYTIACYTYKDQQYKGQSTAIIQADMQNWTNQIKPILGDVEVFVFAKASDLDDYSGTSFKALYDAGFRYFVSNTVNQNLPKTEVNATYVRQTRLMVTGNAMGWYSSRFEGMFDTNIVLDMASRNNNIPN